MTAGLAKCAECSIRHRGLCSVLTADQLKKLGAISRRQVISAGRAIFRDGDETLAFANIVSGVVKLTKVTTNGQEHIIALLHPPDFLGQTFSEKHRFSAVAATDVVLCTYPKGPFLKLLAEYPQLEHYLFECTVRELDVCREWTLMQRRKSSSARVASFLLMIARRARDVGCEEQPPNVARFQLPLSRQDMADYLGLTMETVSRQLGGLKRDGVIRLETVRDVVVPDLGRLSRVAEMEEV